MTPEHQNSIPPVTELLRRYSRQLALIILPSVITVFLVLLPMDLLYTVVVMLPLGILAWILEIGLMLHIVDNKLEATTYRNLLSLGASYWTTMFRANLLLATAALAIIVPLIFIDHFLHIGNMNLWELIATLVLLKWNLLLAPVLYTHRGSVIEAWKTASRFKLSKIKNIALLFIFATFLGSLPEHQLDHQIHRSITILASLALTLLNVIINLTALRLVGCDGLPFRAHQMNRH